MSYSDILNILGLPNGDVYLQEVEAQLEASLISDNAAVSEPAQRVTLGGGKRLRPLLTLASANAVGMDRPSSGAIDAAASIELVHVGSLIHDDLMDNAVARRGIPTVNAVEGWQHSVVVGNFVMARAGQIAASISKEVASVVAAAIASISVGQSFEMLDLFNTQRSEKTAIASIAGKSGALTSAACEIGGYVGGALPDVIEALAAYGNMFGICFQLIDDVLDLMSTEELLGKPVGLDIRAGVYTVPILRARGRLNSQRFERLLDMSAKDASAAAEVLELVRSSGGIEDTIELAQSYSRDAAASLSMFSPRHPWLKHLIALPDWYIRWALSELVPT